MRAQMPTAYANPHAGYTPHMIAEHVASREAGYRDVMSTSLDRGDIYLLGQAEKIGDTFTERAQRAGFVKFGPSTAPFNEGYGVEIKELLAAEDPKEAHMGSALLYLAIRDLADDEPVHGRILGYNTRALELATDGLGMTMFRRDGGYPFGQPPSRMRRLLSRGGMLMEVDWSWYGALAGNIKDRLVDAQPWLEEGYDDA